MSDPYDMPTCIACGDVAMFCSCIEKEYDKTMKKYRDGKKCPECLDEKSIITIEYGFPGEEMREKYERGEIKLGGCVISEDNPEYHCNKCENEWYGEFGDWAYIRIDETCFLPRSSHISIWNLLPFLIIILRRCIYYLILVLLT